MIILEGSRLIDAIGRHEVVIDAIGRYEVVIDNIGRFDVVIDAIGRYAVVIDNTHRCLLQGGMTEKKFELITHSRMPNMSCKICNFFRETGTFE